MIQTFPLNLIVVLGAFMRQKLIDCGKL